MNREGSDNLAELQALLYRLITSPEGVAAGLAVEKQAVTLEEIIVADQRMTSADRLGIYADAYFYRLLDALKEDFPGVLAAIGADEFHNLISGYLLDHPPAEPSMLHAGKYLADYLSRSTRWRKWPYLADLARLERALINSFHAADANVLERATLQAIAPEEWPSLRLRLHPAVRLISTGWRVDEILQAFARNAAVPEPEAGEYTIVIWRTGTRVDYRAVDPAEASALQMIDAGCDFAAICAALAESVSQDDVPYLINRLLARWLADGLLLDLSSSHPRVARS